jgi:hypothetical protein
MTVTTNRIIGIGLLALTAIAVVLLVTTGTTTTGRTFALAAPGLVAALVGAIVMLRRR